MAAIRKTVDPRTAAELDAFVKHHEMKSGGMKQRDKQWYKLMATTIGGSELSVVAEGGKAALENLAKDKARLILGIAAPWGSNEACMWGSMFEEVTEQLIAVDLGSPVKGSDICIQCYDGHRTSPDGYIVATVACDAEGRMRLVTTAEARPPSGQDVILLLEFKSPHVRAPDGGVSPKYRMQVLSGLAVSPIASLGLFVDCRYRKCSVADYSRARPGAAPGAAPGGGPGYDDAYHVRDEPSLSEQDPTAWGVIAVYAPAESASYDERMRPRADASDQWEAVDAVLQAKKIYAELAAATPRDDATPPPSTNPAPLKVEQLPRPPVDIGGADRPNFVRVLRMISDGLFVVKRGGPHFADGRGSRRTYASELEGMYKATPPNYWLFGVIPWKLYDYVRVLILPERGLIERLAPAIKAVHDRAAEIAAMDNPKEALQQVVVLDESLSLDSPLSAGF